MSLCLALLARPGVRNYVFSSPRQRRDDIHEGYCVMTDVLVGDMGDVLTIYFPVATG